MGHHTSVLVRFGFGPNDFSCAHARDGGCVGIRLATGYDLGVPAVHAGQKSRWLLRRLQIRAYFDLFCAHQRAEFLDHSVQ